MKWWEKLLEAVFPSPCPCCKEPGHHGFFCYKCRSDLAPSGSLHIEEHNIQVLYATVYDHSARSIILNYKVGGLRCAARGIARHMVSCLNLRNIKADYVVPVPSHPRRSWSPSETLGENIARILEVPWVQALGYNKQQRDQKSLSGHERWLGERCFLKEETSILSGRVLVVDDLSTTGATMLSAIKALEEVADITEIITAVWAWVPPEKE